MRFLLGGTIVGKTKKKDQMCSCRYGSAQCWFSCVTYQASPPYTSAGRGHSSRESVGALVEISGSSKATFRLNKGRPGPSSFHVIILGIPSSDATELA
jgi:hypothetical protein